MVCRQQDLIAHVTNESQQLHRPCLLAEKRTQRNLRKDFVSNRFFLFIFQKSIAVGKVSLSFGN